MSAQIPQTTKAVSSKSQMQVAGQNSQTMGTPQTNQPSATGKQNKVMITGDDILIEYVSRLSKVLSGVQEDLV